MLFFSYQEMVGTTAAWMLRNETPTVTRTPPRGLRQHKRFSYRLLRSLVFKESDNRWGNRKTIKSFKKVDRGFGYVGWTIVSSFAGERTILAHLS